MKLKYKKVIVMTVMSTMSVGLLTLSINHKRPNTEESISPKDNGRQELLLAVDNTKDYMSDMKETTEAKYTEPVNAPSPTSIPLPVYPIEEVKNSEINSLFQDCFAAIMNVDTNKLKSLYSDPSNISSSEELQKETQYIDDYRNIKCYAKKGYKEGTYIVYVNFDLKFINIETPAPALYKFYVITDPEGKLKIYSGVMDKETKNYYSARNDDTDVQKLINATNIKGEEAKAKDKDLRVYWESIDNMASAK